MGLIHVFVTNHNIYKAVSGTKEQKCVKKYFFHILKLKNSLCVVLWVEIQKMSTPSSFLLVRGTFM